MPSTGVPFSADSRFRLLSAEVREDDFASDVRAGLTAAHKSLPPRWFYDDLGSLLFEAICNLPEYYVSRAETEILKSRGLEIAKSIGADVRLVELGSGSSRKTRLLLDELDTAGIEYVPIDVDAGMLARSGQELMHEYPALRVTAIRADFASPAAVLRVLPPAEGRTVVLFLGSTIGNLDPAAATALLRGLHDELREGDALLLGVDLRKPPAVLEPAYDDALGVTAAFNLNVLQRINRELGGHFDLRSFAHRALYDQELHRIEMHLVSLRDQSVKIDALELEVAFAESETIHTENSWKYDEPSLMALALAGGFTVERIWTDSRGRFADALLRV
jgi:dimethylhistidine N-methyltransferase